MFSNRPEVSDPLSEVVRLLRPRAAIANVISGKGDWAVRYTEYGLPSFCIVLEGSSLLAVDGLEPITITAGDFVLMPTTPAFTLSSFAPAAPVFLDPNEVARRRGEVRYGARRGQPDMRSLGGAFMFDGADAQLLTSLFPRLIHVQGSSRLAQLVNMVSEESSEQRPGGEFMLERLVQLLLVEAMRSGTSVTSPPGLLRGLGDERLARALKQMHAHVDRQWTVAQLANAAALSRSAFFDRFTRTVGVAPMEYLLRWRMALAKELLRGDAIAVSEVAERVGYGSSSTFSVAFSRHVGLPPSKYARAV